MLSFNNIFKGNNFIDSTAIYVRSIAAFIDYGSIFI